MTEEIVVQQPGELATRDPFLDFLERASIDPRVDPAKLGALLEVKERVDARSAKQEFNASFARLMLKMPRVQKNGTISLRTKDGENKGSLPFAKWEDVDRIIRPLLAEEGFSLSFTCEPTVNVVQMTGHLKHVAGHEECSTMQLPPDAGPGRNSLQAIGSSHSYGKRYIAFDMLNIITVGKDDDGNGAGAVSDKQANTITDMLNACELGPDRTEKFLKFAGASCIEEIQKYRYDDVMQRLRQELRKKQAGA